MASGAWNARSPTEELALGLPRWIAMTAPAAGHVDEHKHSCAAAGVLRESLYRCMVHPTWSDRWACPNAWPVTKHRATQSTRADLKVARPDITQTLMPMILERRIQRAMPGLAEAQVLVPRWLGPEPCVVSRRPPSQVSGWHAENAPRVLGGNAVVLSRCMAMPVVSTSVAKPEHRPNFI